MLSALLLIILFSLMINWMISLTIMAQVSDSKNIRNRFFILAFLSGILTGYIIYLL